MQRRRLLQGMMAGAALLPAAGLRAYPDRVRIETLRDVLNVSHLELAARGTLSRKPYHFVAGAADDGLTKSANRAAWESLRIRPRRLVDVSRIDTSVSLFGKTFESPILLAPVGNQQTLHPDGEIGTARAAAARRHVMIAPQMGNASVDAIAAADGDIWFQMYPSKNRDFMQYLAQRAEAAGCHALVLTIDGPARGNHEAARWFAMHSERDASAAPPQLGNFTGFAGAKGIGDPSFTWRDVEWLAAQTKLPLILKGIVTAEDALLCGDAGAAGVVVSNHGGRQEGNGRGTGDVLAEVVAAIDGRMPVLVDGGIRRGADAFKALALGAAAVCVGRPYLWGLGAFGQPGVEKALRILQSELERTLRYAGTPTLADITPAHVIRA